MNSFIKIVIVLSLLILGSNAYADQEETKKAMEFFSTAGIPGDKWIEGETIYPYVFPASHFKATMLYYPGTEDLQSDEIRVTFMGSTYYPNQSQSGMSIFVELGNGVNGEFGTFSNVASPPLASMIISER